MSADSPSSCDLDRGSLVEMLQHHLELEELFGVDVVPRVPTKGEKLEALRNEALKCTRCELHKGRRRLVFGEGNPDAELMFVGEAPGYEEDMQGRPFVGPAGQLLTRIIRAIDMDRSEVYIANVLKDRPPQNRNPGPDEMAACWPWLFGQIEIIQPKVICGLGKFAAQALLNTTDAIRRLRNQFHDYQGIPVMITYHPSYVLRNPQEGRRPVWEDVQMVRDRVKALREADAQK